MPEIIAVLPRVDVTPTGELVRVYAITARSGPNRTTVGLKVEYKLCA